MTFKKYQSLTRTDSKFLEYWQDVNGDKPVIVTEKIHGANYQCSFDGTGCDVGSRTTQLSAEESFYGDLAIRQVFQERVRLVYTLMKEQLLTQEDVATSGRDALIAKGDLPSALEFYKATTPSIDPNFKSIRIRGELYGGLYNHPDVAKNNCQRVGKGGISYSQVASIAVFSIEVDDVPLPFMQTKVLCFSADLPTVPVVFMGNLNDAVAWSNEHISDNTLIPNGTPWVDAEGQHILDEEGAIQALPVIEGNAREGHVIRFQEPVFTDKCGVNKEVIFKAINPTFSESLKTSKCRNASTILSHIEQALVDEVSLGFTKERMLTQFSYEDYICSELFSVIGKIVADCLGEAKEQNPSIHLFFEEASAISRKRVTKALNQAALTALKPVFFEVINERD